MLAIKLHGFDHLVKPVTKAMVNSTIFASERYSSFDMKKIIIMTDIKPQPLASVLEDIL